MADNLLVNGDFETPWHEESSHECFIFYPGGGAAIVNVENIHTPPGWATWFYHDPRPAPGDGYDQPEVRDTAQVTDQNRTCEGQRAMCLFTFERRRDAGFLQQVDVVPGTKLRLSAKAHAWSSHPLAGHEDCHANPRCSAGVGEGAQYIAQRDIPELTGDPWNDAIGNFIFSIGIDPTGGVNPLSDNVQWGAGAAIYNTFARVPGILVEAEGDTVTVFLSSKTLWPFKHNDAYWDDIRLEEARGHPREQYARTYVLLPPRAERVWASAAVAATWDKHRFTIGGSADDAGIGDLDDRRVIAINPGEWGGDMPLGEWYELHYPGVEYVEVVAEAPVDLFDRLGAL